MNNKKKTLSVIMPCYRGEAFIQNSICTVQREVRKFNEDFEVVVVVDGRVDDSYSEAEELVRTFDNLVVVGYERNRGKGHALRYGFENCRGDYVAFLDSDLDYDPGAFRWFLDPVRDGDADLVIGNRKDVTSTYHYPAVRKVASWGFNLYVRAVFPELEFADTQAGIKLMRKEVPSALFPVLGAMEGARGFIFDICFLIAAKRCGFRVIQAPCVFEMKESTIGTGRNFLRTAYSMGIDVWKLRRSLQRGTGSITAQKNDRIP